MRRTLLSTVAAIALLGGTHVAMSEGMSPGAGAGGGGQEQKAQQPAQRGGAGQEMKQQPSAQQPQRGTSRQGAAQHEQKAQPDKKATDKKAEEPAKPRSTTGQGAADKQDQKAQQPAQKDQKAQQPAQQRSTTGQGAQPQDQQPSTQMQRQPSQQPGTATQGQAGASVTLNADQKAKIRTTVLQSSGAPKVERSQINFSTNVGTLVPRSVKLVAVPATLVEIQPAWRGYLYFVVGDEIIVVEPRTLKIVAVLVV